MLKSINIEKIQLKSLTSIPFGGPIGILTWVWVMQLPASGQGYPRLPQPTPFRGPVPHRTPGPPCSSEDARKNPHPLLMGCITPARDPKQGF